MPEYDKIIANLEHADAHTRKCEEAMIPLSRVKQVDAYILGLLQSIHLLIGEATKAAHAAERTTKQVTPPRKSTLRLK